MRSFILAAAASLALASAGAAQAQLAYEWSPQHTKTHLTGTLVFEPGGGGAPFQCKVALEFYTGNIKKGADKLSLISSAVAKGKGCESVHFAELPWYVGAESTQEADLSQFEWTGGGEGCVAPAGSVFFVTANGQWQFNGTCLLGDLTPDPPVTIIAVP